MILLSIFRKGVKFYILISAFAPFRGEQFVSVICPIYIGNSILSSALNKSNMHNSGCNKCMFFETAREL